MKKDLITAIEILQRAINCHDKIYEREAEAGKEPQTPLWVMDAKAFLSVENVDDTTAISFAKWIVTERYNWDFEKLRYVAAWDSYKEFTAKELFNIFHKERIK